MGLKINEYGVFQGEARIAGATEEEVYATLKLPWIPPEIRENQGEIEAARGRTLPSLISPEEIRGIVHCHLPKNASAERLDRLREAARERHWEYLGIVVSELREGVRSSVLSASARERFAKLRDAPGNGPRLIAVEEVDTSSPPKGGR